jgi:hypothetical protein
VRRACARAYNWIARRATMEWLVALVATTLSVGFSAWYASQGLTLAYGDAIGHEIIARAVFDNVPPGLAQLGTVWLPLHHILMLPFIWNDWLYQTGLAGALPSMAAYVLSGVYLFRTGRLVFGSPAAGWAAALALLLNPSVLYMQATPMSELDLVAAAIVAIYYTTRWAHTLRAADLVKAAAATAAGTLIRYDAWALALALLVVVIVIAWRRKGRAYAEASALTFGVLGFAGCAGWLIYNWVIFGDALEFIDSPYSARSQQQQIQAGLGLPTYHNLGLSAQTYSVVTLDMIWWPIAIAALFGLLLWVLRTRLRVQTLPLYATLVPFAFNCLSLVMGISIIETPEITFDGVNTYFNVRYGLVMVPAVALCAACLVARKRASLRRGLLLGVLALAAFFSVSSTFFNTPYALQDPLNGIGSNANLGAHKEANWLDSHYHGGAVLISKGSNTTTIFYSQLPDQAIITETNGARFQNALAAPQDNGVTWIVMTSGSGNYNPIWASLSTRFDWRQYYALQTTIGATQIYKRIGSD